MLYKDFYFHLAPLENTLYAQLIGLMDLIG